MLSLTKKRLLMLVLTVLSIGFVFSGSAVYAQKINVGLMGPMNGPTADAFRPFASGFFDHMDHLNYEGGINGKEINVILKDTRYDAERAVELYEGLKEEGVEVIHGWGTGASLTLRPRVNEDQILFFSASYDDSLGANPKQYPYNMYVGASYSQQARAALDFINENHESSGSPTVAVIRNPTAFGESPFKKEFYQHAERLGFEVVEELVELSATRAEDALEQMKSLKEQGVDYGIIQQTVGPTMAIIEAASQIDFEIKLIGLNWAMDDPVIETLGEDAEGFMGLPLFAQFFQEEIEGIQKIREYSKRTEGRATPRPSKYIAGWTSAQVVAESMRRAEDPTDANSVLNGARSLDNYNPDGLCPAVSFSSKDHRGQTGVQMYIIKNGRMLPRSDKIWEVN